METIALFGGSFDPPHSGHIAIVRALQKLEAVDTVVVMPTYLNPFKERFCAPAQLRLSWLKKIFDQDEDVVVSDFEVKQNRQVPTIETVRHLLQHYQKIYVVVGADNLASLSSWYRYDELCKLVTFVVATRDDMSIPDQYMKLDISHAISSSQLRETIDPAYLPIACSEEIEQFYKENNGKKS